MGRSGLIALADGVRALFAQWGVPAVVTPVGWRYRSWQINQGPGGGSRVCFMPGMVDPTSDTPQRSIDAGTFAQPTFHSTGAATIGRANPRRLLQWHKTVSLSVWGVDVSDLRSDEKQIAATEDLVELTYRAIHNAVDPVTGLNVGLADVIFKSALWVLPPVEQAFGREFFAYFDHAGPLFDAPDVIMHPQPNVLRNPAS